MASLVLAMACGSTISLDEHEPLVTSSGTIGSSGSTTSGDGDALGTSTAPPAPDVPRHDLPPPPPLPGACPDGCEIDLPLVWTWEDERPPPEGGLPVERRLTTMLTAPDGGWLVAEHRDATPWLTRVSPEGALVWSVPLSLLFDAELVDMALHPSGELSIVGQGVGSDFYREVVLGRFDLAAATLQWETWDVVSGTPTVPPRVASVIAMDDLHAAVLVIEGAGFGSPQDEEWVELMVYQLDDLMDFRLLGAQTGGSEPGRRPLGARLSTGELVITLPGTSAQAGHALWLDAVDLTPFASQLLPEAAEAVGLDLADTVVVASHSAVTPQQVLLRAAGLPAGRPPAWVLSTGVPTTSGSSPALAVDALGSAVVALRTTAGTPDDPRDPALLLTRLAPDGTPVWTTSLPLAVQASPRPIGLALADDDDLVLAAIVDHHLHLERREQTCRCD